MLSYSEHVAQNVRFYGGYAAREEDLWPWMRPRVEVICGLLREITDKGLVADVGCHTGLAACEYLRSGAGAVHGYDVSEEALAVARRRGIPATYWNADGTPCPAGDGTYDVVIAADIVEHLVNTDSFAAELHRILKASGHLIVSTPNLASWYNRLRLLRGVVPDSYPGTSGTTKKDPLIDLNHIRIHTLDEWQHFFRQHGFRVGQVRGASLKCLLRGGLKTQVLKVLDRLATRRPSLANIVVLVLQR
ncbi:MAG: class I SAM-dependent methyltransferase [Chloroflexi bacterium]|nr:class I SAM-dependent methyltransferase [Chloroflexota bacterium]